MSTGRRQIVLEAMDGRVPARVPVAAFSGGDWSVVAAGETFAGLVGDARRIANVFAAGQRLTGSDIIFTGSSFNNYLPAAFGASLLEQPGQAPAVVQPIVSGPADLSRLDPAVVVADPAMVSLRQAALLLAAEIGDQVAVTLNCWAPFTLAGQFAGLERLLTAMVEEPEFVQALVDVSIDLTIAHLRPALATGRLELVSISDPTASANLISRRAYEQLVLPATRRVVDVVRSYSAKTFLHVCGRTTDRLDLMVATGAACLSLDTAVDLAEARRRVGPSVCLAGNVDPTLISHGTPEEVYAAALASIAAGAGGPLILAPGCDFAPDTPVGNIQALVRAARR